MVACFDVSGTCVSLASAPELGHLPWYRDPLAPAWFQAVGAVLALLIAVGIPVWQARVTRRAAISRGRSLGITIFNELLETDLQSDYAVRFMTYVAKDLRSDRLKNMLNACEIPMLPLLAGSLPDLYLLGEPLGLTVQQMLSTMQQYERLRVMTLEMVDSPNHLTFTGQDASKNLLNHALIIRKCSREAIEFLTEHAKFDSSTDFTEADRSALPFPPEFHPPF